MRLAKRIGLVLAAFLGVVLVVVGAAALWVVNTDFRPLVEREAGGALEREMSVGSLVIGWRNPLRLELTDVRIANMPGGSEPDMMRFGKVLAEIDLGSLLRGVMRFERLTLERPRILLERHDNGARNWRFPGGGGPAPRGGLAVVPKNRTQFPTLIDFTVGDGQLIYRSEGRQDIRLDFRSLAVRSSGDDSPVGLTLDGAYNGKPVRMDGSTDSFARLRDESVPFGTELRMTAEGGMLGFRGTMSEPTDFEGVRGPLHIEAGDLGRFIALFGVDLAAAFPLQVDGALDKQGERWRLTEMRGRVAANRFTGEVTLDEGARGQPDAIVTALDFPVLDVAALLGERKAGGETRLDAIELRPDEKPGAVVDARLRAARLLYRAIALTDFLGEIRTRPGDITVSRLAFGVAAGRIEGSGRLLAVAGGGQLNARTRISNAEVGGLVRLFGGEEAPIDGRLNAVSTFELTGETLANGLKASRGQMVLAMREGQLARDLLEKASADLRALFRRGQGWVPLECLIGVIDLRDGLAKIGPLRLRTPRTTLRAAGFVDLPSAQLDLVLRADSDAANAAALKLPIKIAGPVADPRIGPAFGSLVQRLDEPDPVPEWMVPELPQLVAQANCAR